MLHTVSSVQVGPLTIHFYGLVYAIAFGFFLWLVSKRRAEWKLSEKQADWLILWVFMGLLFGARLFHFLFDNFGLLLADPVKFFYVWQGGMAFFGAAVGVTLASYLYFRYLTKHEVTLRDTYVRHWLSFMDTAAFVACGAIIFGRFANFINQELVGIVADPSKIFWCVEFATASGCRHPYQLYAVFMHTLVFIVLFVFRRHWSNKQGLLASWFITLYTLTRFLTDFWREETTRIFGISHWQIICVVGFIVGVWLIKYLSKNEKTPEKIHGKIPKKNV